MKLSPHFTLAEVTATRHGENIPNEEEIERLRIVVLHAEVIRAEFSPIHGLTVTSGFRSEEVNRKIGGAPNSAHLYGCALDLVPNNPAVTIEEIWRWLPTSGLLYDQAIWEIGERSQWLHYGLPRPGTKARMMNFIERKK